MLDTNIVSHLARRPQSELVRVLADIGPDNLAISVVVAAEIAFGLQKLGPCRLADNVRAILAELPILPLTPPVAEHYGDIRATLERAGTPIGPNDLFIAAHARALDMVLLSANAREFQRVPGLRTENPLV